MGSNLLAAWAVPRRSKSLMFGNGPLRRRAQTKRTRMIHTSEIESGWLQRYDKGFVSQASAPATQLRLICLPCERSLVDRHPRVDGHCFLSWDMLLVYGGCVHHMILFHVCSMHPKSWYFQLCKLYRRRAGPLLETSDKASMNALIFVSS